MSQTLRCTIGAAAAAVALYLLPSDLHGQTTLRWKFQPGTAYSQKVEQKMVMTMQVGAQPIVTKVDQLIDVDWNIGEVDAQGNASLTQEFTRMRMTITNAAGPPIEIDSDSQVEPTGPAKALFAPIKALAHAKFMVKMAPSGDILEVEVSDQTVAALQSLPGIAQLGEMFSKDGLVKMVKQGSQKLPPEAIAKGRSWASDAVIDLPQVGQMTATTTMTYEGPETVDGLDLERVHLDVDTKITPGANSVVTLKDQTAQGKLFFNAKDGCLHHSTLQQNMTMQVKAGGNAIEQKMEQTINVTMTPVKK